jgi:hypothetical protein
MTSMETVLILHCAVTCYMAGVIWFVQVVHYPLFSRVGKEGFGAYEHAHVQRTGWAVGPPMIAELGFASILVWSAPGVLAWAGLGLVASLWLTTIIFQVPAHRRLRMGFDELAYHRLLITNWLRTAAWSARVIIAILLLQRGVG